MDFGDALVKWRRVRRACEGGRVDCGVIVEDGLGTEQHGYSGYRSSRVYCVRLDMVYIKIAVIIRCFVVAY